MWVFGMADTSTSPGTGYMEIVDKRDATTLPPIIQAAVQRGSTIHSDEWRAYNNIQGLGFTHKTVNHSINFADLQTGVHEGYSIILEQTLNKYQDDARMQAGLLEFLFSRIYVA